MFRTLTVVSLCLVALANAINGPKMYIFGDIHYDPYYGTHLAISDKCNTSAAPALGMFECDTPPRLLESAIADIFSEASEDGDGIFLLTGDFVRHKMVDFAEGSGSDRHDKEYALVYNISKTIATLIEEHSQEYTRKTKKNKRLHVMAHQSIKSLVSGNEDCVPHYHFDNTSDPAAHPALAGLARAMQEGGLLSPAAETQFAGCAYYAQEVPNTNLVILALNTILYSLEHRPNSSTDVDPCGQFAWLTQQLEGATVANKRVMMLGHIIPDATKWFPMYLDQYRSLMMAYTDTVSVQWFGHTHMFTFLTLSEHVAPVLYDVPAITPRDGNVPSYLKVSFMDQSQDGPLNESSWTVDQIQERFLDITKDATTWQDGMQFPADFSELPVAPITTNDLYNFGLDLLQDKKTAATWEQFEKFYFGGVTASPLSKSKRNKMLCKAITASASDYAKCKKDYP